MDRLILSAAMEYLDQANNFVQSCAEKAAFDPDTTNKVLLATEEIFTNIVNYAYRDLVPGEIELVCRYEKKGTLQVQFIDQGREFNPLEVKEPDTKAPVEKRQIGGLGIFLVKKLMDSVRYERDGQRNILTCIKIGNQ